MTSPKVSRLGKLGQQARLAGSLVRDYAKGEYRQVPWWTVLSGAAALVYFFSPIDIIPDFIPVLGLIDDAIVLRFVLRALQEDLRLYAERTGKDPSLFS